MSSGRNAATYFAHTLMGLIFTTLAIVCAVFGQDIEATIAPVVIETRATDSIYRDENRAFFTLHLHKEREGSDPRYECYAQALLSPRVPVSLFPSDEKHLKYGRDLTVHPVGKSWPRVFGFDLPQTIAQNQTITLHCNAEHWSHFGWRSLSYLQPINICGIVPDDPPADLPRKPDVFCDKQREAFARR